MRAFAWAELAVIYLAWWYPFIFRAPHVQKRQSITVTGRTRIGLALETVAIFMAWLIRDGGAPRTGAAYLAGAAFLAVVSCWLGWTAVTHLGKQFRIHAGLYHDHELVRTGPYAVVRHPIYASLMLLLVSTILIVTPWLIGLAALVVFVIGTEIRVHTEDGLLASRFGDQFRIYQKRVPAYIPFIR